MMWWGGWAARRRRVRSCLSPFCAAGPSFWFRRECVGVGGFGVEMDGG